MSIPLRIFYRWTERFVSRFTDAIITVCETNRNELIKLGITPEHKINTIYSGIDTTCFEKQIDRIQKCVEIGLDPDRPIVGTVARLSEQKAPLDFIAAARLISQTIPNVQFVMVGDGPLRSQIQTSIKDMQNIILLGARSDVPELLQTFDVFALASLWEGLGRALTEALLIKLPVAVTAVDGVPEVVIDGLTGLLSPPKSPHLLAHNIIRLLSDREFAKKLGARGSRLVQQELTISSMVNSIDKLYSRLLTQN
jgi:glycosyltransferase involved in cell wall biosynthesis